MNDLYCLDTSSLDGRNLITHPNGGKIYLSLVIRPCIPKQLTEENAHLRGKECIYDDLTDKKSMNEKLEESKAYMGDSVEALIFYNKVTIDPVWSYISRKSAFATRRFSSSEPTFAEVTV